MVAAPESAHAQAQQQQAQSQQQQAEQQQQQEHSSQPLNKSSNKDANDTSSTLMANGVDGLTVVDNQAKQFPSSSNVSSHNSNFDPTAPSQQAQANLPPRDVAKMIPCRFFPQGTCKYGDSCIFSHGIPGIAGSPGVPPSPSVQAQQAPHGSNQPQPAHLQQQQQGFVLQHSEEYMHGGMPMYYPEQHLDQYGYSQASFSPQNGGYYPFPPPFYAQQYQQAPPPPQPFYPAHQQYQHQQQQPHTSSQPLLSPVVATDIQASSAPISPVAESSSVSPSLEAQQSTAATSPMSGIVGSTPSSAAPAQMSYYPHGQQQGTEFAYAAPTSPTFAPSTSAPSIHTFFQNGSAAPITSPVNPTASLPSGPSAMNGGGASFVPGKLNPRANMNGNGMNAARPRNSIGGSPAAFNGNGLAPNGKPLRRFPAGSPRPPCTYFEANRCRNRDACPFQHILPDGTDARLLGQGWVGADGRTDNPEEKGGLPAAWLANPNYKKNGGGPYLRNGVQGPPSAAFNNGFRHQQQPRRFDDEQARLRADTHAQQLQHQQLPGGDSQNGVLAGGHGNRLHAGGDAAPQLVAAIHGLTRRIPPVHHRDANATSSQEVNSTTSSEKVATTNAEHAKPSTGAAQPSQRVPSGDDFPALSSAPLSPSLEASTSRAASPPVAAVEQTASEKVEKVVEATQVETTTNTAADHDFVIVNHSDAPATEAVATSSDTATSSTVVPAQVEKAAPAPSRVMGSFASAAARGASVVVPEKPKRVSVAPTAAPVPAKEGEATNGGVGSPKDKDKKDGPAASTSAKKSGKSSHKKTNSSAPSVAPVAIKA